MSEREVEKEAEEANSGLSSRRTHGEDAFDEALPVVTLGAEADLSPENGGTNRDGRCRLWNDGVRIESPC